MSSQKSTSILDNQPPASNHSKLWDKAIADAEELIENARGDIQQLKKSIELSKRLRAKGAAFPGEGANKEIAT